MRRLASLCALIVALASLNTSTHAKDVPPSLLSGLAWRNIGPFRGGRVSAVAGVVGQPATFYMGLPFGGVWKTVSAGMVWFPVFDSVTEIASIGSIEVAPSDPNVVYVGTGDPYHRNYRGTGVYKSSDAGQTWQHLGLTTAMQVPTLLVDPHDANMVLAAATCDNPGPNDDCGVLRTTDGGKTWQRTLSVEHDTGVQNLAWAYDAPTIILAVTGNGAIYKSADEGLTWKALTGGGLPTRSGRVRAAVAANTKGQRMFLAGGGLYRTDDSGATWRQMAAADRRIGTERAYVDTKNPDVIYNMNTSMYRSTDGGTTFESFKGAPGGDDPHVLWIDPTDSHRLLLGGDQGATISFDGGGTWSSWYNQSTAQIYHIGVDNSWPYWVYGQQQDSGAVATRSRGDLGAITPLDWYPTPGYESGYIVADPLNPKVIYANGPDSASQLIRLTLPSNQWIHVGPNLDASANLGTPGPLVWDPVTPHTLLVGYSRLMATSDGGAHWRALSGEVGATGTAAAANPGPQGRRGTISALSVSTIAPGLIWMGASTGGIKVTRNHGVTWSDVTIGGLPNTASIASLDASHQQPGTAYAAVSTGQDKPLIYRTHDFGKTWTAIVTGLPADQASGSFVNVIRADTKTAGLLFAGTENSVFVSFNDGDAWQPLRLNLPTNSVRDLVIHENDLVICTFGRGIWILDDYSRLRQMTGTLPSEPAHLFKPGNAVRVRWNVNGDTPFPPEIPHAANPPVGVILDYYLSGAPSSPIAIEIADATGTIVRHYSSIPPPAGMPSSAHNVPEFWLAKAKALPTEAGAHRINWDLRYDPPPSTGEHVTIRAVPGETRTAYEGPLALPGVYAVTLVVDAHRYTQTVRVRNDPRSPATLADIAAQHRLQMKIYGDIKTAWAGDQQVSALRTALQGMVGVNPPPEIATAAAALSAKLPGGNGGGRGGRGRGGRGGAAAGGPSDFLAVGDSLNQLLEELDSADMAPNATATKVFVAECTQLKTAVTSWQKTLADDLAAFNAVLVKNNRPTLPAPAPALTVPVCAAAPAPKTPATR
jgi:photosystem II stability/assembly factor-like uncharacterized protein